MNILTVPIAMYCDTSYDRCTYCKSLWIKASAKRPKCKFHSTADQAAADAAPSSAQGGPSPAQGSSAAAAPSGPGQGSAPQPRAQVHKPFTQSRLPPDLPMHPAPRHVTEDELRVLEGCLHRWRSEVENDTRGTTATAAIAVVDAQIRQHIGTALPAIHSRVSLLAERHAAVVRAWPRVYFLGTAFAQTVSHQQPVLGM